MLGARGKIKGLIDELYFHARQHYFQVLCSPQSPVDMSPAMKGGKRFPEDAEGSCTFVKSLVGQWQEIQKIQRTSQILLEIVSASIFLPGSSSVL